jgi:phosphohistidine phosphatase SixA
MPILLLRHAKAGQRKKWEGPDHLRPLSKKGWKQAEGSVELLAGFDIDSILSSPFVRCVQTVQPLAEQRGLKIEETDDLAEGASPPAVVALARRLAPTTAVLCTHGDVIPDLLEGLARSHGLRLPEDYPCAKGSVWVLEADAGGAFTEARYLPPPGRG